MMPWTGAVGTVTFRGCSATLEEWRFEVDPPYGDDLATIVPELLSGVAGHFIIPCGAPDPILKAVIDGLHLVLLCRAGAGVLEVTVEADAALAGQPNVRVEVFPFTVVEVLSFRERGSAAE